MRGRIAKIAVWLLVLAAISAWCGTLKEYPQERRVGKLVTVRGVLHRGGKAGNVWTLELDEPLNVPDPTRPDTDKAVSLKVLRFIGGSDGPQKSAYDNKHVELTGTVIGPFGFDAAGVRVKKVTILKSR